MAVGRQIIGRQKFRLGQRGAVSRFQLAVRGQAVFIHNQVYCVAFFQAYTLQRRYAEGYAGQVGGIGINEYLPGFPINDSDITFFRKSMIFSIPSVQAFTG